ncbi:MAG: hypothetical protein AB8G16_19245 [Gammaproteobacteria bacterium]
MSSLKLPGWFWAVAVFALLWNLMGVMAYVMQVTITDEALAALPDAERLLYETAPPWATGAFALAVFGGALGCIALLLRKRWAVTLFAVSLVGVCVQMFHSFFMTNSIEVYGPGGMIMPIMIMVIGIALLIAARRWSARGWLN